MKIHKKALKKIKKIKEEEDIRRCFNNGICPECGGDIIRKTKEVQCRGTRTVLVDAFCGDCKTNYYSVLKNNFFRQM